MKWKLPNKLHILFDVKLWLMSRVRRVIHRHCPASESLTGSLADFFLGLIGNF